MQWTDEIEIVVGKVPSLNAFYSSRHWTFRKQQKDKWKKEIHHVAHCWAVSKILDASEPHWIEGGLA